MLITKLKKNKKSLKSRTQDTEYRSQNINDFVKLGNLVFKHSKNKKKFSHREMNYNSVNRCESVSKKTV
jgi:hypothetical protein